MTGFTPETEACLACHPSQKDAGPMNDTAREAAIVQIIDPEGWEKWNSLPANYRGPVVLPPLDAIAKAEKILALFASTTDSVRLDAEAGGWRPIESAPRDGTRVLGWNNDYGARETRMNRYGKGSPGHALWEAGAGPAESGWNWSEPQNNWGSSWSPTHWRPLPAPPTGEGGEL